MAEKVQHHILDKVLSKHSKHSKSAREIEYQFYELCKYLKSPPGETTAERVNLMPRKRKIQEAKTRMKVLTPNKLLIRLSIISAQIKVVNNVNKLKYNIKQIIYLSA